MTPSTRLLWFVGLVFVPACALPAFVRNGALYVGLTALLICAITFFDWLISRRILHPFIAVIPETIRATVNEEAKFPVELYPNASVRRGSSQIRLAIALPAGIEPICDDIVMPAPGEQQGWKSDMAVLGRERGKFPIRESFLGASSRLGLWQMRRTVAVHSVILVEPPLRQIFREAAKLMASHQIGGQRIVARHGRGREFEQLREYVPSDDFGDIDWKATARRRKPIVREYQIERTQDVYACIDSSRLSGAPVLRQDEKRATVLDEYIHSTLVLHSAVHETGDRFGFATFSNKVESFVKATHAPQFNRVFREALYPLRPKMVAPGYDEVCSLLRTQVKRRALMVFFTNLAEPQLADAFFEASRLLVRQHLIVVACPADAQIEPLFTAGQIENADDIYGKLAGHLLWKKLADVRLQLARIGVRMHTVAPGRFGMIAATEYLDIKEKQLL